MTWLPSNSTVNHAFRLSKPGFLGQMGKRLRPSCVHPRYRHDSLSDATTTTSTPTVQPQKIALVMGVANQRSIAWACVEAFLAQNYNVIITHQERFQDKVAKLVENTRQSNNSNNNETTVTAQIVGHTPCNVESDLPLLFEEQIPEMIHAHHDQQQEQQQSPSSSMSTEPSRIHAIAHCIAFGDLQAPLRTVDWQTFSQAQHISAFSFLETAQCASRSLHLLAPTGVSMTALSYLGAVRAVQPYHVMGPAKASLESLVRGMALEFATPHDDEASSPCPPFRVNAVSAGPIATLSARGGIGGFSNLQQSVSKASPLGRPVSPKEVAETVAWLSESTGITGQIIYVDGGYSSIVPTQ